MKAVTLQLDIDQLKVLNKVWTCRQKPSCIESREERVINDVAQSLAKRLKKKEIDKEFNLEEFTISFSYSEGHFLERILINKKNEVSENVYEDTIFQKAIFCINQQLS